MRAIVFDTERRVRLVDRPRPSFPTGSQRSGVLVEPRYIGICGTDLHAANLDHFRPGVIMGHEFSACVIAIEPDVTRVSPGDRVVINPNGNVCGVCDACRRSAWNLCRVAVFERGVGIHEDGGMAEHVVLDERTLYRVPDEVDDRRAAWVEPLATALRAVRLSGCGLGDGATVVGAGPIGLLVTQLLKAAGATLIQVAEPASARRDAARRCGATAVLAPSEAMVDFEPTGYVFECAGNQDAISLAVRLVRDGGVITVVGISPGPLVVDAFALVGRELTIRGSIIYQDEFAAAIDLLRIGYVDVDSLTSDVVPLESFADAFEQLSSGDEAIKILLHP